MPIPPPLSREQRIENLKKACAARTKRSFIKKQLADGNVTVFQVIQAGKYDDVVGRLKPIDLLLSIPGLGRTKANKIIEEVGIAPSRRIRGLGKMQTAKLIDAVKFY